MITKITKRLLIGLSLIMCHMSFSVALTSCVDNDDDVPMTRYTSEKMTAAAFLEDNPEKVGSCVDIMKKTPYFALLSTYGDYTVFAPNNEAIAIYLSENSYATIEDIPSAVIDTLVRTHIIKDNAFFTTDKSEGSLGQNMAETYIEVSVSNDASNNNAIVHYANTVARMVEFDDSVTNGVVHIVNRIIPRTSDKLPDVIAADSLISIFSQALFLTGMADSLMAFEDETYPEWGADKVSQDSVYSWNNRIVCKSGSDGGVAVPAQWPEKRYFKFTAFIEPDAVYNEHDIYDLNDLIAYAKKVYDAVYPQDAGKYDNDFKSRKNPLNRFVSYHLLDRILPYDEIIGSSETLRCWDTSKADPEEFYETMCPGTIMRFCYPNEQLYINRKGLGNRYQVKGVRVLQGKELVSTLKQAPNGMYHYLDDILEFNETVRDEVLNCRLRFDSSVLSPDFQNSGARGRFGKEQVIAFRLGYIKNWKVMGEQAVVGMHGDDIWWSHYKSNGVTVSGIFDATFKLPPVPKSGTYEIRVGYTVGVERGVVQFYLDGVPCGIPADLRIYGSDPTIGWVADVSGETTEAINANKAIDKAMRNHGYMKGMDCYWQGGDKTNVLRSHIHNLRYIMTTTQLEEGQDYYLRARQVLKDPSCYWSFDYLELCPKSVYGSPEGEDQH